MNHYRTQIRAAFQSLVEGRGYAAVVDDQHVGYTGMGETTIERDVQVDITVLAKGSTYAAAEDRVNAIAGVVQKKVFESEFSDRWRRIRLERTVIDSEKTDTHSAIAELQFTLRITTDEKNPEVLL